MRRRIYGLSLGKSIGIFLILFLLDFRKVVSYIRALQNAKGPSPDVEHRTQMLVDRVKLFQLCEGDERDERLKAKQQMHGEGERWIKLRTMRDMK